MREDRPRNRVPLIITLILTILVCAACGGSRNIEPIAKPAEIKTTSARFLAVGDIMLSRGVNRVIERTGDPLIPFRASAEMFESVDFSFGNLESPVSGDDTKKSKGLVFNTREQDIAGLEKFRFRVVCLANNHALDQGPKGLKNTIRVLDERGIRHVGAGDNLREAWSPSVIEANEVRIGFIGASYSSYNDGGAQLNQFVARIEDLDNLRTSIAEARRSADIVVVTMHAGIEYRRNPEPGQIKFARAAIDFGADVVIGHHPHWIQTIERYNGKFIFYSLGNFIFDQRKPDTKEGLAVKFTINKRSDGVNSQTAISAIELIPVIEELLGVPRPANEKEAETIFKKIGERERFLKMN